MIHALCCRRPLNLVSTRNDPSKKQPVFEMLSACADLRRFRSDSAVKQILLTMNEKQSFIIEDLDEFHLIIKADEEHRVRRELETEVRVMCSAMPG